MPAIVYECDHYCIIDKEHGLNTEPDSRGNPSLMDWLRRQRPEFFKKWGPHPLHRLDRPVSGLLLVAKSLNAHRILQPLFEKRRITKKYCARVEGIVHTPSAILVHYHQKDPLNFRALLSSKPSEGYAPVKLSYQTLQRGPNFTDLDIKLITGRYHQIRSQLAFIGHPIWGDTLYGSKIVRSDSVIALRAYHLSFYCPFQKKQIHIVRMSDFGQWG